MTLPSSAQIAPQPATVLPPTVIAMRAGIIDTVADEYRYYSTASWRENANGIANMYMRRLAIGRHFLPEGAIDSLERWAFIDALDANDDIVETYAITDAGLRYLRKQWRIGLTHRRTCK